MKKSGFFDKLGLMEKKKYLAASTCKPKDCNSSHGGRSAFIKIYLHLSLDKQRDTVHLLSECC